MTGRGVLASGIVLSLGVGAGLLLRALDRPPSALEVLEARYAGGAARPVEGRLSWDVAHASFRGEAAPTSGGLLADRLEAAVAIERLARREDETDEAVAAAAVVDLFEGEIESAVSRLERVVDRAPSAASSNDLAAAYLARARANDDPYDIVLALESAEHALEMQPDSAPARFNVALALERLHLLDAAIAAWGEALGVASGGDWSAEATRRRQALAGRVPPLPWSRAEPQLLVAATARDAATARELVAAFPSRAMRLVVVDQLGEWASRGDWSEAQAPLGEPLELDTLRWLARVIAQVTGDHLAERSVVSAAEASAETLGASKAGHVALRRGVEAVSSGQASGARSALREAHEALTRAGSPARWLAAYELARNQYRSDDDAAVAILDRLGGAVEGQELPLLAGRIAWLRGILHLGRGEPAEGLASYRAALAVFERAGDERQEAAVETLLAEGYQYLGASRRAWRHRLLALQQFELLLDEPRYAYTALETAAGALLEDGHYAAARWVQDEVIRHAERLGRPEGVVFAYVRRARIWQVLGQNDLALADLEVAESRLPRVADAGLLEQQRGELMAARGRLLGEEDPEAAIASLSEALAYFVERGWLFRATEVYGERARLLRLLGRIDEARADLERGVEAVERQRSDLPDLEKVAWFDRSHELFQQLVALEVDAGRPGAAFAAVERSRARSLLDARALDRTVTLAELEAALPAELLLLEYFQLEDRLLVWAIRSGEHAFREVEISSDELARETSGFVDSILRRDGTHKVFGAGLYQRLLGWAPAALASEELLVLAPGGSLAGVPFAALRDDRGDRYLVETNPIAYVPSASFLVLGPSREETRTRRGEVLVVGNPLLADAEADSLPPLPSAEDEARGVAGIYSRTRVLLGAQAEKSSFLRAAGAARVVHFAGHTVASERSPGASYLALAGTEGRSGRLYARELAALDWGGSDLIVLSSCSGADGPLSPAAGVLSLGRALLMGGASAVIAGLWPVRDAAASALQAELHGHYSVGASAAESLRGAQVGVLSRRRESNDHPFAWAGFVVLLSRDAAFRPV